MQIGYTFLKKPFHKICSNIVMVVPNLLCDLKINNNPVESLEFRPCYLFMLWYDLFQKYSITKTSGTLYTLPIRKQIDK